MSGVYEESLKFQYPALAACPIRGLILSLEARNASALALSIGFGVYCVSFSMHSIKPSMQLIAGSFETDCRSRVSSIPGELFPGNMNTFTFSFVFVGTVGLDGTGSDALFNEEEAGIDRAIANLLPHTVVIVARGVCTTCEEVFNILGDKLFKELTSGTVTEGASSFNFTIWVIDDIVFLFRNIEHTVSKFEFDVNA